jgi:hypothetical protein
MNGTDIQSPLSPYSMDAVVPGPNPSNIIGDYIEVDIGDDAISQGNYCLGRDKYMIIFLINVIKFFY